MPTSHRRDRGGLPNRPVTAALRAAPRQAATHAVSGSVGRSARARERWRRVAAMQAAWSQPVAEVDLRHGRPPATTVARVPGPRAAACHARRMAGSPHEASRHGQDLPGSGPRPHTPSRVGWHRDGPGSSRCADVRPIDGRARRMGGSRFGVPELDVDVDLAAGCTRHITGCTSGGSDATRAGPCPAALAVGSLLTVGLVIFRAHHSGSVRLALGVACVVASWAVLHTIFVLRYALLLLLRTPRWHRLQAGAGSHLPRLRLRRLHRRDDLPGLRHRPREGHDPHSGSA